MQKGLRLVSYTELTLAKEGQYMATESFFIAVRIAVTLNFTRKRLNGKNDRVLVHYPIYRTLC